MERMNAGTVAMVLSMVGTDADMAAMVLLMVRTGTMQERSYVHSRSSQVGTLVLITGGLIYDSAILMWTYF